MIRTSESRSSKEVFLRDPNLQRSIELDERREQGYVDLQSTIETKGPTTSIESERAVETPPQKGAKLVPSILNLVNTTIGAGILSLPAAFRKIGFGMGLFFTVLFGFFCWYAVWMMIRVADWLIAKELRENTSKEAREITVNFKWVCRQITPWTGYVNNFFIFLYTFGILIAYLIIVGDAFPKIITLHSEDTEAGWYKFFTTRQFWMLLAWFVVMPFNFLKKLDSLKYISYFIIPCIIYTVMLLFVNVFIHGVGDGVSFFPPSLSGFESVSVFSFAYACHISYYTIYNEYAPEDRKKFANKGGISASTIVCVFYAIAGLSGYIVCGENTDGNIINSLPGAGAEATVARVAVALNVSFSYPLLLNPCRIALISVLKRFRYFKTQNEKQQKVTFYVSTILIALGSLVSLPIQNVDVVLNFVGCLSAPVCSFILPGYNYYKIFKDKPGEYARSRLAALFSILGFLLMIIGFVLQIYALTS